MVTVDGAVRCWGSNTSSQQGQGNAEDIGDDELPSAAPDVDVGGGVVVDVDVGSVTTCVRFDDGGIKCWGRGDHGALGQPGLMEIGDDETPASIGMIDVGGPATDLSAASEHTCALLDNGGIKCWGPNESGQLGQGNTTALGAAGGMGAALKEIDLGS